MVGDDIINNTAGGLESILTSVGNLALWMQTIGLVVVLWILFEIAIIVFQVKRKRSLKHINERLINLERKIDKLIKKK